MPRYRYVRGFCRALFCPSTPNKTIVLVAEAPFDIAQDRLPMIGLVLVTHGRLADEFRAALEHVMGPQKQIEAITIGAEDAADLCRSDIIEAVNRVDSGDGVAILTDMFGGTPSNLAISCMSRPNVEVLAGINLPMLVKLAKVRENRSLPEAVDMAQEAGRKYVTIASSALAGK
jgi:PTS system mannose-specific IIA component